MVPVRRDHGRVEGTLKLSRCLSNDGEFAALSRAGPCCHALWVHALHEYTPTRRQRRKECAYRPDPLAHDDAHRNTAVLEEPGALWY